MTFGINPFNRLQTSYSSMPGDSGQPSRVGANAIGGRIATFFAAVGARMAELLRSIGQTLASLAEHVRLPAIPAAVAGPRLSAEEKQVKLSEAKATAFYGSLPTTGEGAVTQEYFDHTAASLLASPPAVAAMKEHGVTLAEAVAISMYTSQGFFQINNEIRSGTLTPPVAALRDTFESGLAKLPSYSNPGKDGTVVYRGASLPEEVGNKFMTGKTVIEPGILSTTSDETCRFDTTTCNFSIQIILKAQSAGKDISMFSEKPSEREIAFPPGCSFKVTARELEGVDDVIAMFGGDRDDHNNRHPRIDGYGRSSVVKLVLEEV